MKTIIIIITIALLTSCSLFDPTAQEPQATFKITGKSQTYYSSLGDWSSAQIYYEVENTGGMEIDYYKVYFTATMTDGSKVYDWDNGSSVGVGKVQSDNTYIDTQDKKLSNVVITSYDLTSY